MSHATGRAHPSRAQILANFAAVYVVWGSTYLAIRFAIETIPPLLMAGIRFLVAGSVLYAWARARGAERPSRVNWRAALVAGALLLFGGNGAVVWAEQLVPSGIAALLVATVPIWMVLVEWLAHRGGRPSAGVVAGLVLGLGGLAVLVGPSALMGGGGVAPLGAAVLTIGSIAWAVGSLYTRHAPLPRLPLLSTAMEMLAGGAVLVVVSLVSGEAARLHPHAVTARSLVALGYLVVFGSLVGFTAYVWLLNNVQPTLVSTYAYVNPIVAVFLGWAIAGEPITARTIVASAIIIAAVALISLGKREKTPRPVSAPHAAPGGSVSRAEG